MGESEHSDAAGVPERTPWPDCGFPADFTPDEIEFAAELQATFSPEREDLPPLYVQTIAGDSRYPAIEASFEQKVTYQVFRRLGLPRRGLFEPVTPHSGREQSLRDATPVRHLGRAGGVVAASVAILMLVSVVLASPSFAAGVRLLLGHTGAQPVASYPSGVLPSTKLGHHGRDSGATAKPPSTVDWLGAQVEGYVYQNSRLDAATEWSDGPIVELLYQRPGNTPGSGTLDIREFKLSPAYAGVLQVVAAGSATSVTIVNLPGVYVDGRWVHAAQRPTWEYGVKSELILERDGLIFWIVADQRDGTGQSQLVAAAAQLKPIALNALEPNRPSLRLIGQDLQWTLQTSSDGELYSVYFAGTSLDSGEGEFVTVQAQTSSMR